MKTAIFMPAYRRPAYFRQSLVSLMANPEVEDYDLWCFIDGPRGVEPADKMDAIEKCFRRHTPATSRVLRRERNVGVGHQIVGALDRLLVEEHYDRAIWMPEDVVVAPYALAALLALQDAAQQRVGVHRLALASMSMNCQLPLEEKRASLRKLRPVTKFYFVCITRDVWAACRTLQHEYLRRFIQPYVTAGDPAPYRRRNTRRIRAWFAELLGRSCAGVPSSQDFAFTVAVELARVYPVVPLVNHAHYIGKVGEHGTPAAFRRSGYHRVTLDLFPREKVIEALSNPVFP